MKLNKGSSRRSPSGRKVLIRLNNDAELEEIDKIEKNRHFVPRIGQKRTLTCIASRFGNRLHETTRADVVQYDRLFPSRLEAAKPSRMSLYPLVRPFVFAFDAERAHRLSLAALKLFGPDRQPLSSSILSAQVAGLRFPNPVGLAAGYDKDAEVPVQMLGTGFGFVEVGTLTPLPQAGNPQPRLFRLVEDRAVINRMGFNNGGVLGAIERLKKRKSSVIVGGNIGKNKVTPNEEALSDYLYCLEALHPYVDYFVVNVSSPNTPGLRALQDKDALHTILSNLQKINATKNTPKPLLLKIAPDLTDAQLDDIIALSTELQLDGLVATNTTIDRRGLYTNEKKIEAIGMGGLSGKPLTNRSTDVVRYLAKGLNGQIPIIASGGIFTAEDATNTLNAGATLVQVWTGFVYEGPGIVKNICSKL